MNPEESQTPEPINEWLEQIEVQPPTDEILEKPSADLELEAEASGELVTSLTTETTALESADSLYTQPAQKVIQLQHRSADLKAEITQLEITYETLQKQVSVTQIALSQVVQESLLQLEQRKQTLQISVGVGTPASSLTKLVLFSSLIISMQSSTHSSQIKTVGPAISFLTSC
jgi:hypothetical protein